MKISMLLACGLVSLFSASALAEGIPADAKTFRELDCTATLDGQYANVKKVVFKDVTYKTPPAGWDNYNSEVLVYSGSEVLTGALNESNGNDPQDDRDSASSEDNGWGGFALYPLSETAGQNLVLITRSFSNQRDLPVRNYYLTMGLVDANMNPIGTPSKGTLNCKLVPAN